MSTVLETVVGWALVASILVPVGMAAWFLVRGDR